MVILLKVESLGILGGREFDFAWKTWVRSLFYFQMYDWIQLIFVEIWKGFYFEVSVLFLRKSWVQPWNILHLFNSKLFPV